MSSDPLRTVWDALEARDCRPRGRPYDFRSRCPGHDGKNPGALHVQVGADGRCVMHCFAHGCTVDIICAALGLDVRDLFPDGHHRARHIPAPIVKRHDFKGAAAGAVNVLYALEKLGEPWQIMLAANCPFCGEPGAWLTADSSGRIDVDCIEGCTPERFTGALLGRLKA